MNNIYEIEKEIEECYNNAIDKETGEIIDMTALARLEELQIDKTKKLKGYRWIIKKLESECELAKLEKKRLNDFQRICKNNIERMKNFLLNVIPHENDKLIGISFRTNKSVELDETFNIPPNEDKDMGYYTAHITYTPNKDAIKKALLSGEEIKGARIVEKDSISFGNISNLLEEGEK